MSKVPIDPNAKEALNQMKIEIANELGITSNNNSKGQNVFFGGYVGGQMTKKLVEMGEKQIINKDTNN